MALKIVGLILLSLSVGVLAGCTQLIDRLKPKAFIYINDDLPIDQPKVADEIKGVINNALAHPIQKPVNQKKITAFDITPLTPPVVKPTIIPNNTIVPSQQLSAEDPGVIKKAKEKSKLRLNLERYKAEHPEANLSLK